MKKPSFVRKNLGGRAGRLVLGVTGGIASGKTTVTRMLAAMGAPAVDFDQLAREVVLPGSTVLGDIVRHFGEQVLNLDGTLNRKRLSELVFADPAQREILEGLTHPPIFAEFYRQVERIEQEKNPRIIQAVAPLLCELNLQPMFDKVVLVYIKRDEQIRRLVRRDRITVKEAESILKAQMPIDEKIKCADFVIDNSGTLDQTRGLVQGLWQTLQKILSERQGRS